jgi:asparagine synthase (glutamine-hydrolysing)
VGFEDAFSSATSEGPLARVVAQTFGTDHHELTVDGTQVLNDFPRLLAHLDQPSIDGVNSFYVSKAVAETGIKAVLSGTGGDELFGGYPSFTRIPRAMTAKRFTGAAWPGVSALGDLVVADRLQARWRHFAGTNGSLSEAYRVQRGFLMPDEIATLAGPALRETATMQAAAEALGEAEEQALSAVGDESMTASVARLESRLYLRSQLLRDLDVMAMTHGLEVRVPFVDHELLGTVWPALGAHRSLQRQKRLLVESLARPLPAVIAERPKQGFTLPFDTWLGRELATLVRAGISELEAGGWVAAGAADRIWREWRQGGTHWTRPWGLGILGHFLRTDR